MRTLSLLFLVSFFLMGCGLSPLTDEQKAEYKQFNSSMGRTQSGAIRARGIRNIGHGASSSSSSSNGESADPTEEMAQLLIDKQCIPEVEDNIPEANKFSDFQKDGQELDFKFKVSLNKDGCPMSMNLDFSVSGSASLTSADISSNFNFQYSVSDEAFAKYSDVTQIDISGDGNVKADMAEDMTSGSAEMDFNVSGTVTSTKHDGDIDFDLSMSGQGSGTEEGGEGSYDFVYRVDFPEFSAELKMEAEVESGGKEPKIKYTLNGEEIEPKEFSETLTSLANRDVPTGASVSTLKGIFFSSYSH